MNDASKRVSAWKFLVELKQPDGSTLPRTCYVRLADRDAAAKALIKERPDANFRIDYGEPLTEGDLHKALGDTFLRDEVVRCVPL
jgi:hypothetical protein